MRKRTTWTLGGPSIALLIAACLLAAPLVFAFAWPAEPHGAPARPAAAHPAALRACTIVGTPGDDTLVGTPGPDVICARGGDDTVRGGGGDDVIYGGRGDDRLYGGAGDDRLYGFGGTDRLYGGAGTDFLQGGAGPDVLSGGSRADIVDYSTRHVAVRVTIGRGADDGHPGEGDDVRRDVEEVIGGSGDDVLIGDGRANRLIGGAGRDMLRGGRGDDRLSGGRGADRLDGRDGSRFTDLLDCGAGRGDLALADAADRVAADCEKVRTRRNRPHRNHAPTDVLLSNAGVAENRPAGTVVGALRAVDRDRHDTATFALAGGADDAAFAIDGATLKTARVFDFETKRAYSIRIRATDRRGASTVKAFTITITNADDPPTADAKRVGGVREDGAKSLELSGSDPEGDPLSFRVAQPLHGHLDTTTPAASCDANTPSTCTATVVYTPDGNFNGTDTITYKVNDGTTDSAAAAVTATIDPVNDAPDANDGDVNLSERTPTPVDLGALVSDVETADADLTYTIVSGPAHGTLTGSGASPIYTAAAGFNGSDSFTYRVTDRGDPDGCRGGAPACDAPLSSATRTVSITVAPVNAVPVAAPANLSVDEDHALAIDLGALASDAETSDANLTYTIVGGPAHGTLTGAGGSRTYTPDADYNGADSLTYRVTDRGDPDNCGAAGPGCTAPETSSDATISIAVGAVDDAPVNTLPPGPLTALQHTDTPIAGLSVVDVDAGGDDVRLTLSVGHGTLTVSTSVFSGVGPMQVAGNGTRTVALTASVAKIDTTLTDAHGLVYRGDAAYTGPDTLTAVSDDLGHNGSGGPLTDTDALGLDVVAPNQAPVASDQTVTTAEDTAKAITLAASDADGDALTFHAAQPQHGRLTTTTPAASCAGAGAVPSTCTAGVTYTPDPDYNGPDSFTFTVNDGRADSAPATVSVTVTLVDDAPVLAGTENAALAYTENDPATAVTATTTVSDVDSADFDTGTLTVDFSAGGTIDDRLAIADRGTGAGQIGVSGANVTFAGTTIGTFAGGSGTTALVVTLDADADATAVQALVRAVTYGNVSDNPSTAARTVRFVLTDGDGGTSAPAGRAIAVTAVNDPPVLAGIEGAAVGYVESVDSPPRQSQVTNSLTVSDPDDRDLAGATVQITGACRPGEDVLVFGNQNGISGTYTAATCLLTLTGSSSLADYQAALRSVTYETTSDTPDTTTRTVTFQVDDGRPAGHASNTQARDVTVTAANDSPAGAADTFNGANSALAGVTLAVSTAPSTPNVAVSGNLLANDTDPDTPHASLTAVAATASAHGGVVAVDAGGSFSYTPAPGFTGTDTFTYTVHDNASPDRTSAATTVTINVAGPRVWFVSPGGGAGNGTSLSPLSSLAPLSTNGASDSLDGNGDVIFVYQGSGNATSGGLVLEANQRLAGQPQGLSVTDSLSRTFNLVAAGGANPTITNTSGAGLTLADGNTIQRVDVTGASGIGVTGTGVNTLDYGPNTTISGNGGGGLALSGAAGGAIRVGADITTSAGHSVAIANRTSGTTSLSGAINDTGTGISLTGNTGATINLTGGVTAGTGANAAFTATGGGTVGVTGATNSLTTGTGTALDVANTTIGANGLTFRSISAGTASGSAGDGIVLDTTGMSGGLTVTGSGGAGSGGTIQHKTGADGSTGSGIGIYLNSTSSVSLARMQLNDFDNFAVRGTSVNGFTLANSTINGGNGTSTAADEASLAFTNLTGSAALTNDTITGGVEDDARITNSTGSLSSLSVTGSTFATTTANTANDALAILGQPGTAVLNATVQNNTFTRAQGDLFQYTLLTGTGTLQFDSNTVTNNFPTTLPAGGGDINVSSGSTASATQSLQYSIDDNNIYSSGTGGQPPNGSVIVVAATPQGSATGTIRDNAIGTTGVTQSGGFDAILADAVKAGFHKVTITGNTIRRYKEAGIRLLGVSPAASPGFNLRATVKGNLITEPDSVAFAGIDAEAGADPADVGTMCLDLGGAAPADANSVATGDPSNFNDINIIQQFATGITLPGYAGAATDDAAVQAFVAARNAGNGAPAVFASHDTTTTDGNAAGSGFTGSGSNCS